MTHVTHRRRAPHVSELGPINDLGTLLNSQSRAPAAHTQTLPQKSRIVFTRAPGLPRSRCRSFTRPRERNPRMIAIDWAPSNAVVVAAAPGFHLHMFLIHALHTYSSHMLLTHAPRNAPRNAAMLLAMPFVRAPTQDRSVCKEECSGDRRRRATHHHGSLSGYHSGYHRGAHSCSGQEREGWPPQPPD
eukprot:CAMPEP_0181229828 /NCGR_PEP_ID=MMETSP1096-20121128/34121_1 /TAXON_ID=156174 ORGANISM="Chrysochromulina ericina, Strain CCMP281" /NCGR_SAMPLE_ID=MMETSP1096 /ASSEMBLY_ACC=CAM_ASM_000453 /LENGTH=187 /DNA_ID=CAMNT_0023323509 /DNA_START=88 /DNA_END=652 /DNA_ORIENTATION=+